MTEKTVRIERYTPDKKWLWDDFAAKSRQNCLIFNREYIDYHRERFSDHSLLAFKGRKLIAMLPLETEGTAAFSHRGLTFGGWLTPTNRFDVFDMAQLFDKTNAYFSSNGIKELIYKPVPWIYSTCRADEDVFVIERIGGDKIESDITMAIDLTSPLSMRYDSRQNLKKAIEAGVRIVKEECMDEFWGILSRRLEEKYNSVPVHSLEEIKRLKSLFPGRIHLYAARDMDCLTAGVLVYESKETVKAQYIASTERGRETGAVTAAIVKIIDDFRRSHRYLDLGTSRGHGMLALNEGLTEHKYGLGGRPILTNVYRLRIS